MMAVCLASTRFEGWRQLEVQGPSSGLWSRPGSVGTIVVHVHVSHALHVWRGSAGWSLPSCIRGLGPVAGNREFQNHGMMDHPIHGRRRGHGILEDLVPLAEDEIAGDQHRPALIAFGQQGEQHVHLFAVLLHIPEVIENERVKAVEPFQFSREAEIAFGREQALDELEGGGKEHGAPLPDKLQSESTDEMGLARAGIAKHEHIGGLIQERALSKRGQRGADFGRQSREVERRQTFPAWQLGLPDQAFHPTGRAVTGLLGRQCLQIGLMR